MWSRTWPSTVRDNVTVQRRPLRPREGGDELKARRASTLGQASSAHLKITWAEAPSSWHPVLWKLLFLGCCHGVSQASKPLALFGPRVATEAATKMGRGGTVAEALGASAPSHPRRRPGSVTAALGTLGHLSPTQSPDTHTLSSAWLPAHSRQSSRLGGNHTLSLLPFKTAPHNSFVVSQGRESRPALLEMLLPGLGRHGSGAGGQIAGPRANSEGGRWGTERVGKEGLQSQWTPPAVACIPLPGCGPQPTFKPRGKPEHRTGR